MLVVLGGAALWPVVAPLLGAGAAVGVLGGAMGLLGGPGQGFISDFLKRVATNGVTGAERSETELQAMFERELLAHLDSEDQTAVALREDLSRLLQTVGGVEVALEAASDHAKEALAQGLAELGGIWGEFRWLMAEVQDMLHQIQGRQAEALALQREQLDLQREQLVKTNLLIGIHIRDYEPAQLEQGGADEPRPADVACPYKGLEAFQPVDTGYFFGREELVADLFARLAESSLLAVVGASGSGKSSLLRAGVVPGLWAGVLPGSKDWLVRIMTPGREPLEELAMRVSLIHGVASGSLLADLRSDTRGLALAIRQALLDAPRDVRVVLVVDQLEEVFTQSRNDEERRLFLDALVSAVAEADGRVAVIVAVRADFYGRFAAYPGFGAAVRDNQVLVGQMSESELRRAIEQPAFAAGLAVEPGLAEVMIQDLAGEPGALPLLSHALLETWKRRRGRTLTIAGYLESGGVREAIARTADRVFSERLSPGQRQIARHVFFRLTEPGEGTEDTRRRATFEELVPHAEEAPAVQAVVKVLADERLLTTGEGTVEVAHEALIRHWPLLRGWLDEDRAGLRTHRRLTEASDEWERLRRDEAVVYRGVRLAEAVEWLAQHPDSANERERAFVAASVAARQRERVRGRRRITLVGLLLLAGIIASTTAALIAIHQRRIAESRAIAVTAEKELLVNPQLGLLLAIEAAHKAHTAEATDALRQALLQLDQRLTIPRSPDYLALSRDGRALLTEDLDGAALWDLRTSRRLVQFANVDSAALSPSGRRIATADSSDTASIWTPTGRLLARRTRRDNLGGSEHQVVGEQPFSPDEKLIVTSDGERAATVWDPTTGRRLRVLHAVARVANAGFSPDGRYIQATTGDSNSEVWKADTGGRVATFAGAPARFSPDGHRLVTLAGAHVDIWSLPSGRQQAALPGQADVATFSEDGRYVLTLSTAGVRVFAASGWKRVAHPPIHIRLPAGVPGFSPDGRFAMDSNVLFSVTTGEAVAHIHAAIVSQGPPALPVFSPGGTSVIANDDMGLHVWAIPDWHAISLKPDAQVLGLQAVSDHQVVAVRDGRETARVWDIPRGASTSGAQPQAVARIRAVSVGFSADGRYIAALTPRGDGEVWRISPWAEVARIPNIASSSDLEFRPPIAISANGRVIGVLGLRTSIWDVATRRQLSSRSLSETGSGDTLAISADGQRVATPGSDGVQIWDTRTGRLVTTLRSTANQTEPAVFNRDGTRIVTVSDDETARVWDVRSGKSIAVMIGHTDAVTSAAFSADEDLVTTTSVDGTVRVWESNTGHAVATLPIKAPPDTLVGFSAGPTVVTAANGLLHTVACEACLPFGALLAHAERRALRRLTPQERHEFLH